MKMKVEVTGGRELSRALKTLGDESTPIGRRALRGSANGLRDELKASAPYAERSSTVKSWKLKRKSRTGETRGTGDYGHLRDNIRVTEERARIDNTILMRVHTGNAFWALFLEYGTKRMAAQPWMRPVFDRMGLGLINEIKDRVGAGIERKARQLEKKGVDVSATRAALDGD